MGNTSVSEEQKPGVSQETPKADGVSQETPAQSSGDAEERLAKIEQELAKREQDINKLKSASQRREHEIEQEAQREIAAVKNNYEAKLRELMSDEAREQYDEATRASRIQALESDYVKTRNELEAVRSKQQAYAAFVQRGVPAEILADAMADGSVSDLSTKAWDWLAGERERLMKSGTTTTKTEESEKTKEPPKVVTHSVGGATGGGPDWPELIKRYGSEDRVWAAVDSGRLPKTAIPEIRKAEQEED